MLLLLFSVGGDYHSEVSLILNHMSYRIYFLFHISFHNCYHVFVLCLFKVAVNWLLHSCFCIVAAVSNMCLVADVA